MEWAWYNGGATIVVVSEVGLYFQAVLSPPELQSCNLKTTENNLPRIMAQY